jgi:hypothetical protein
MLLPVQTLIPDALPPTMTVEAAARFLGIGRTTAFVAVYCEELGTWIGTRDWAWSPHCWRPCNLPTGGQCELPLAVTVVEKNRS